MSQYPSSGLAGAGAFPTLTFQTLPYTGSNANLFVNPYKILAVQAATGGAKVYHYGENDRIIPTLVTQTPAAIAAASGLVEMSVLLGATVTTMYFGVQNIATYKVSGSYTRVLISVWPVSENPKEIDITESIATLSARITAALALADVSSTVTVSIVATGANQAGAAAVTSTAQNVAVSITGGAAKTGIALAAATSGQKRTIINATSSSKVVYPAVGGFFIDQLVNEGITINGYEAVDIYADSTGKWAREENSTIQTVTGSGTIQGGGVIQNDTETVLFTPSVANPACTLPAAVAGKVVRIQNISSTVVGRVFPALGATINGGTVNVHISLAKSGQVTLVCNIAGAWVDANIQQSNLVIESLQPPVGGQDMLFKDPTAGTFGAFNVGVSYLDSAFTVGDEEVSAAGGGQAGATLTNKNVVCIMICGTVGDGIQLSNAGANTRFIKNFGAECANIYGALGTSVNGVVDGFASVNRGAMAVAMRDTSGNWAVYEVGGAQAGVYTAFASGGQGSATLLRNEICTIAVCATAGDSVILNNQYTKGIVINGTATAFDLFPPVGSTLNGVLNGAISIPAAPSVYSFARNGAADWIVLTEIGSGTADDTQVFTISSYLPTGTTADTYILNDGLPFIPATGSLTAPPTFTNIYGSARSANLIVDIFTNATAPVCDFTIELRPISSVAGVGAVVTYTLSAVLVGATVTIAAPGASSASSATATFTLPASANPYVLAVTTSAPIAAGAHVHIMSRLQLSL